MSADVLFVPSNFEQKLAEILREQSIKEIKRRADPSAVAVDLGLTTQGVEALLWRCKWKLDTSIRVANALGIIDDGIIERL